MIKIYINSISLDKVKNSIKELNKFLHKEYNQTTFYSQENGIFIKEKGDIYYLEPSYEEKYETLTYLSHNLIIDSTNTIKIKVASQLPIEYIMCKKNVMEYKLHNKSMTTLVVSGGFNDMNHFIPLDFYFECKKGDFNMENIFFLKEFNGFLSLLN